jgi:hypothetical protein
MQRWLPWEQVVQVCERLKQRYERGERGSEQRARALMEFLVAGGGDVCGIPTPTLHRGYCLGLVWSKGRPTISVSEATPAICNAASLLGGGGYRRTV